jgi:hypothetical protein
MVVNNTFANAVGKIGRDNLRVMGLSGKIVVLVY